LVEKKISDPGHEKVAASAQLGRTLWTNVDVTGVVGDGGVEVDGGWSAGPQILPV
jgi:hypothetical protein